MGDKKYKFDRYEIHGKLGRGGMAMVYLARHVVLNRMVALKVLLPQFSKDDRIVRMFYNEAEAMAKLNHRYIVKIFDINQYGHHHYFAMEYIDGNTLKDTINKGNLSGKEIIILFREICEAIKYIHDKGILHLDIKANNILQTKEGQIKITDFGIGKIEGKEDLTKRMLVGTVEYMAPEQLRNEDVDKRSDLYSLGIVLYELLTGELPYKADTKKELMLKKLREVPVDPIKKNPFIPYRLGEITMKLITIYPEDRFQDIQEVIDALNREEKLIEKESNIIRPTVKKVQPKKFYDQEVKVMKRRRKKEKTKKAVAGFFKFLLLLLVLYVIGIIFSDKVSIPVLGGHLINMKLKLLKLINKEPPITEISIFAELENLKKAKKVEQVYSEGERIAREHPEYQLLVYKDLFSYSKEVNHDQKVLEYFNKLKKFQSISEIELMFDVAEYFNNRGNKKVAMTYYKKIIEISPDSELGKFSLKRYKELLNK